MPLVLGAVRRSHPDAEMSLVEGEPDGLVPRVLYGDVDIAVTYHYDTNPRTWSGSLTVTKLMQEDLLVHLPPGHPMYELKSVLLRDLSDDTWIERRRDGRSRLPEALCAAAGFVPRIEHRSNNYEVIRGLVRASLGVALVPALACSAPDALGQPGRRLVGPRRRRHVNALHRPTNATR